MLGWCADDDDDEEEEEADVALWWWGVDGCEDAGVESEEGACDRIWICDEGEWDEWGCETVDEDEDARDEDDEEDEEDDEERAAEGSVMERRPPEDEKVPGAAASVD